MANYQQVLRTITYDNASQNPDELSRVITFVASDGTSNSNLATTTVAVTAVNDAPVGQADAYSVNNTDTLVVNPQGVLANDYDAESPLQAQLVAGPSHGVLIFNANGSFTYIPNPNYAGPDSFSYRATDGSLATGDIVVEITVVAFGGPGGNDDGSGTPGIGGGGGGGGDPVNHHDPDDDQAGVGQLDEVLQKPKGPVLRDRQSWASDDVRQVGGVLSLAEDARPDAEYAPAFFSPLAKSAKAAQQALSRAARAVALNGADLLDVQYLGAMLHELRNDLESSARLGRYIAGTATVTAVAFTAGYAAWALRSAHLLTMLLSTLPAWWHVDPLPLLTLKEARKARRRDEEDESLEDMVAGPALPATPAPPTVSS